MTNICKSDGGENQHTISQNEFFRMNFILQDDSATTTKTYLAKIIEFILYQNKTPLSIENICERIEQDFDLEFSFDEVREAINVSKSRKNRIVQIGDKYELNDEVYTSLSEERSIESLLHEYTTLAVRKLNLNIAPEGLYNLITSYLYYSFNTSKDMLLSLLDREPCHEIDEFRASDDQIKVINAFLSWNNAGKDKLVYKLVSYCYVYCSLTTKKNALLSKRIFRNKHFILDANIIFRLAGINNDERQHTIKSFVKKSSNLGIRLSYTDQTYEEIQRVIDGAVQWIKSVTNGGIPIDLTAYDISQNDFYNIYCRWSAKAGNDYNNFQAFRNYLVNIVGEVLDKLNYISLPQLSSYEKQTIDEDRDGLRYYKDRKIWVYISSQDNNLGYRKRNHTDASLNTDIRNVYYIYRQRSNRKSDVNIFNTNVFFISADHILIAWCNSRFNGIPVAVLPSIWLTIMLRFTGRSHDEDDFRAFCLFMNLRMHKEPDRVDIYSIIRELGEKTNDNELKRKIITEIASHKDDYRYKDDITIDENNQEIIDKAFDRIRAQDRKYQQIQFESDKEEIIKQDSQERDEREQRLTVEHAEKLAQAKISRQNHFKRGLLRILDLIGWITTGFAIIVFFVWALGIGAISRIVDENVPEKFASPGDKLAYMTTIWTAIGFVGHIPYMLLKRSLDDSKIENKKKKLVEKYTKVLREY